MATQTETMTVSTLPSQSTEEEQSDEAKHDLDIEEQLRAVDLMQSSIDNLKTALQSIRNSNPSLSGAAEAVLNQIVERGPEISMLANVVAGGALLGNPVAETMLHTLTTALSAVGGPGVAIVLSGPFLFLLSGVLVAAGSLFRFSLCLANKVRVQSANRLMSMWNNEFIGTDTHPGALERAFLQVQAKVQELQAFIQERLDNVQEGDETVSMHAGLRLNGILVGIRHGIKRFNRLISVARAQLGLIFEEAEAGEAAATTNRRAGFVGMASGGIVVTVCVLVAVASGGIAIPIMAGVAGIGGLVAIERGYATIRLSRVQLRQVEQLKAAIKKGEDALQEYEGRLEEQIELVEKITESLGGQLVLLKNAIEENKRMALENRRLQQRVSEMDAMQARMQEEMNRMKILMMEQRRANDSVL